MSLARTIIFGSDSEVASALASQSELKIDELDEYGYSPLIQTAIVNSVSKARLVLQAGANPNFTDLTGRTALHWAADNGNFELCKLLMSKGADVNAYTYAGQPVLVMPLLRAKSRIKKLLVTNGADLDFAQDFINAKLLGHRFELEGRVDVVDHQNTFIEIELEGFYLEFSLGILIESLVEFHKNFGGKHFRQYFGHLNKIIASLEIASELMQYQHYLLDAKMYDKRITRLLDAEPLVLPIIFTGHAISLIRFGDLLARCDRGEFGRKNGTVVLYEMTQQSFTKQLAKELLYKRQFPEFVNEGLIRYLGLDAKYSLPLSLQRSGNCSWANVEAIVPTLMFLFLLEERGLKKMALCEEEALNFYNEWVEWDKDRSLHFCIDSFKDATPARKASKAALLASILFQSCDYENNRDPQKANKILSILTIPEYDYIVKSYIKVFAKDRDSADPRLKSMRNFLDDYRANFE
ncbi:MAG: ankyrin repeat domain-containing protein [Gammaproteobacteria bacterium]